MAHKFKGILSFPVLTVQALNNKIKNDPDAKYGCNILFPPNDPQIDQIHAVVDECIANGFPNGKPSSATLCFMSYDEKFKGKEYYNPALSGYWNLSMSDPSGSFSPRDHLVDQNMQPITDPSAVFPGAVVWANFGLSKYSNPKKTGIGAWLNGVMITDEEPPIGRLDNKPTVDQMFANVAAETPASPSAPATPTPPPTPSAPPAMAFTMTEKAAGATRDAFIAQGWTDVMLVEQGYMLPAGGVAPSFA